MSYAKGTKKQMSLAGIEQTYTFLGQGHFNNVWKGEDGLVYYVGRPSRGNGNDMSKDVFQWTHAPGLPRYENLGYASNAFNDNRIVYRAPAYTPITAKDHPQHWQVIKAMSEIWDSERAQFDRELRWEHGSFKPTIHGLDMCQRFANACQEDERIPQEVANAARELVYTVSNIGTDVLFEFKKSAFAIDGEGRLIFRDVAFRVSDLKWAGAQ